MGKIIKFLQEVRSEFKNITWPKKDALIQLTFVVISISIIISLLLGGFDYLFTIAINYIGQPTAAPPTQQITGAPQNVAPTIVITTPEVVPSIKK